MDKFDRIQLLHRIFKSRKFAISLIDIAEQLECSPKTVQRTIDHMRDTLNAPIEYDRSQHGYCYRGELVGMFELPGIWLTAEELQSLIALLHLLNTMGSGLLKDELSGVEKLIKKLLDDRGLSKDEFERRVKFLPLAHRFQDSDVFFRVSEALLNRRQLTINYCSYDQQKSRRTLSPQAIVYYRENWYLDAWCHLRHGLRTFSIARIVKALVDDNPAEDISADRQQAHFADSYGIFSGGAKYRARLRFLSGIANEIASQQWHPQQQSQWDGDEYILSVPYSDDRELAQDILKHIPNVMVEEPATLAKIVESRLRDGLALFKSTNNAG